MQDNKANILLYLSQNYDWVTAKSISQNTGISVRSVKYYVSLINDVVTDAVLSSNKGYKINRININEIMDTFFAHDKPITYLDRKRYILKGLLIAQKEYTISELADELYVSTATLQNELSRIRCELIPHRIKLHIKKDVISISGDKHDIQTYYMILVKSEIKDSLFDIDVIQQMFNKVSLKAIEEIVKEELLNTKYFLDNYSLFSVILHLALLIEFKNYNSITRSENETININRHICNCVIHILDKLKTVYEFSYTNSDIFETSLLLMNKAVYQNVDHIDEKSVISYIGEDVNQLLQYLVTEVEKNYSINLHNRDFFVRFALHLQKLLSRATQESTIATFNNSYIRSDYPMMYSIAVYIAYLITKKTGLVISEDEIAYIALHIGVSISTDSTTSRKLDCFIFSPDYYLLGQSIYDKLNATFSSYLDIRRFITTYTGLDTDEEVDLIISTAQIKAKNNTPIAVISTLVSFEDIQNIYSIINSIKDQKKRVSIYNTFSSFYVNELFYYDLDLSTDTEVIDYLANEMWKKKLVNKDFKKNIYEREKISRSCYGRIAIPHPLMNNSAVSSIAISIHPKAIKWGDNEVNLVIMLSISQKDNTLFSDIFDLIAKPISDEEKLIELLEVKSFDRFVNYIVSNN